MIDLRQSFSVAISALVLQVVVAQVTVQANGTEASSNVSTTTAASTTVQSPVFVVDNNLPMPTGLMKLGATDKRLTIRYSPPFNYRDDPRYSHFLIEYRREGATSNDKWFSKDVVKTSNLKTIELVDLLSGVLYSIRMRSFLRTRRRTIISRPSSILLARTRPPPVFDLKVQESPVNWTNVMVTWNRVPFEIRSHVYNRAVLTYYIEGLTPAQLEFYPRRNVTVYYSRAVLGTGKPPQDNQTLTGLVLGATYRFEVVTYSDGINPTESTVYRTSFTIKIPPPVDWKKTWANETAFRLSWSVAPNLTNVTGYRVSVSRVAGSESPRNFTTSTGELQVEGLNPGSLYALRVATLRSTSEFGKESDEYLHFARTIPPQPQNLELASRSGVTARVTFDLPWPGEVTEYQVMYRTDDNKTASFTTATAFVDPKKRNGTFDYEVVDLRPGALYRFTVVVISKTNSTNDVTSNQATFTARTVPPPPRDFSGSSARGTIYLQWRVPSNLYWSATVHYVIDYYPEDGSANSSTTCANKGQNLQKVTLRNLEPGTGYYVTIKTVAGSRCNSGNERAADVLPSSPAGPILVLTQPNYPTVQYWKQVTLNRVRVVWKKPANSPEKMNKYVVDVERGVVDNGTTTFVWEGAYDVPENTTHHVIKVRQGTTYRVNVTTAVTSGTQSRRSMVVAGINSIKFISWHPYDDQFAFPSLRWRFSPCGRTGRFGPVQSLCDRAYKDTSLDQLVVLENGIQKWMAPVEGLYRIVAAGAGYQGPGGLGAVVAGLFYLKQGSAIQIAVGQMGSSRGLDMLHGGGGGSFVVAEEEEAQGFVDIGASRAMLIAGGAGSAVFGSALTNASSGRISYDAGNGSNVGVEMGRGGIGEALGRPYGVGGEQGTGGGAGFFGHAIAPPIIRPGDSSSPACGFFPYLGNGVSINESERGNFLPLQGGRYERSIFTFSDGGFGGGGSGYMTGSGGGGGYSGGGGGSPGGYSGGGGSYIKFTGGKELAEVSNDGDGYVIISVIGLPSTPPVPVTLYLVIAFIVGIGVAILGVAGYYGIVKCTDKYIDKLDINKEKAGDEVAVKPPLSSMEISGPVHTDPSREIACPKTDDQNAHTDFSADISEPELTTKLPLSRDEVDSPLPGQARGDSRRRRRRGHRQKEEEDPNYHQDSGSESTASSVSSMGTGVNESKFVLDVPAGKLRYRGRKVSRMNSSFTGWESTDAETSHAGHDDDFSETDEEEGGDLPPPPPTPPLTPGGTEEVSEEQKRDFRQKLNMFHEMAMRSRAQGAAMRDQPTFVPSTNL